MNKTLKDITLIDYLKKYSQSKNKSHIILNSLGITNVQELTDYLKDNPENYTREFLKIIKSANETLNDINSNHTVAQTYELKSPLNTPEFLEFSQLCDKTTYGNNLVMFNLTSNDYLKTILEDYDIALLKYLLNHYNFKGNNALIASLESLGPKKLFKLIDALEIYNEQVLRLYKEDSSLNNNIFYRNRLEKLNIIKKEINTITDYLFNYDNFIWGSLSPRQKEEIYLAITRNNFTTNKSLMNLINILTDYTTLSELETGITKNLKRFVK